MPCTLNTFVPTGGGANVVSLLPSMNTESLGAPALMTRNALFWPKPPVSDVRTTVSGPLTLTRQPSYCSKKVFVDSWFNCVVVPTKNGGSALPDETLRTMKFGAPKLLFAASTSEALLNSAVMANSTTMRSPIAKLYGATLVLTLWVKKSMPENGPPAGSWMYASNPEAMGSKPVMMPLTP